MHKKIDTIDTVQNKLYTYTNRKEDILLWEK